ncbi:hypothetical protein RvY_11731 [Ramazzottius varieornatus]|uniref:phosphoinositide 5-phosphatase n=1 Tax=Ramazzottius varieornatus TaxID=947166 RepID=A0A1D1VJ42_RAMVA|nr:hypothetical protein RvY_11731 [Ramazzottius varieornatus]
MVLGKNFKIYHKPPDSQRPFSLIVEASRALNLSDALYFESGVVTTLGPDELAGLKPNHVKIHDAYALLGILTYNAGNHCVLFLVVVNSCVSVGKLLFEDGETEVLRITGVTVISLRNVPGDEDRLGEFVKLLSSGIFYFAVSASHNPVQTAGAPFDLTLCAQRAAVGSPTDNRFFWNRGLHLYPQSFGITCDKWLVKIICGGVEIKTLYAGQYQARACIISRFNSYRAGTRFQVRGANDDGNVANFVETEQLICLGDQTLSFVQIRGSVPLFWEQTGVQVGAHKIKFSRSFETMSPAFERHLNMIRREYGQQVLINLLGSKEGETNLSEAFQRSVVSSPYNAGMTYIHFDYHANVRGGRTDALVSDLKDKIDQPITQFRYFHSSKANGVTEKQSGTVRTNCLDCLDRTNAVQTFIGLLVLNEQLKSAGFGDKPQVLSRFQQLFADLWTQNGDHVSRIYAGTGALDGKSKLKDGARSVSRTLQNNLFDTSKQEAMDILLAGALLNTEVSDRARTVLPFNLRQVPEFLLSPLFRRMDEFSQTTPLTFWVGTWNVNGGKHTKSTAYKDRPLDDWLLDCASLSQQEGKNFLDPSFNVDKPVDVFSVGFEEIVDLNASNIMAASTTNQRQWCIDLTNVINKTGNYVLVNSVQLVGVCLFIFVHIRHVPFLRDVATAMVKTGLGGATGNKGGVAIRFQLYNSSLCFCCSHFAAGQSNVNERNADFQEISRKLVFPADLTPHSHDFVFWCGDFNYRIDMGNDFVRDYIKNENWPALAEGDQLTFSKKEGKTFEEYVEAPVMFAPTYKFDLFSDDYDTSEKCRTPAWTDRVLVRGRRTNEKNTNTFTIVYYGSSQIKSSDHRPVSALVEAEVRVTDTKRCEEVLKDILDHLGPSDGTVLISVEEAADVLYEPDMYQSIMTFMAQLGKILLIRYSGAHLCVTFSTGESALRAAQYDATEIFGHIIRIELRSADWRDILDKVVNLCKNTAVALSDGDQPLLLDENEMSMRIPLISPAAAGLNDLVILEGEESKASEKEVAGSLANMVMSEAADLDSASLDSWSGSEGTTPSPQIVQAVKSAAPPPRPPPARPAPPQKKEVVDPWAVEDGAPQTAPVQLGPPPSFVPVQKEVLVQARNGGHGFDWDKNQHNKPEGENRASETSRQVPSTAPPVLPGSAPPPPPPRRRVGQQLPEVLRNMSSK